MAKMKPFAALRPKPELASRICSPPYDVLSSEEARHAAEGNRLSFLHVSKPEIDLPPHTPPNAAEVYAKGLENFEWLISQGFLRQDPQSCFYLYRQIMGEHTQTGLVATASCEEYLKGIIKKHEFTRPDKEDDRVRHMETLKSQTGPVFLVYRSRPALDELIDLRVAQQPHIDFTAEDGIRHTAWVIVESPDIEFIQNEFAQIPSLYIADGHHRCAAAARVYQNAGGVGQTAFFMSVLFPHAQVQILPYNRVLKDLNGLSHERVLEKLDGIFIVHTNGTGRPSRRHELGFYMAGKWHTLNFRPHFAATSDPFEKLDVNLVQKYVLEPIFGIADPRTSNRINFIGGIRGIVELEKVVNSGEYACAFSMYPTGIEELISIADAGGVMPPKSTWFEPKLRDGMFCHGLGI
jgi:uncharacterized protein (DUF1015 family)